MNIYKYELKNNKIIFELLENLHEDEYDYYHPNLPQGEDIVCSISYLDSGRPHNINYGWCSTYAQFYSTPQNMIDIKNKFIDEIMNEIKREKEMYEDTVLRLSNKLVRIQGIEV
jgi:hypothetical protein